jgi:glycosyltransferase involved in cell wall biosynthesis
MKVMSERKATIICNDTDYFLRHRRKLADALAEQGYEVAVIAGGRRMDTREIRGWTYSHMSITRFGFHLLNDPALAWRTISEARTRRLDSMLLITLKPAVVGGLAALAARAVWGFPQRIVITIAGLGRLMSPLMETRMPVARRLTEAAVRRISKSESVHFVFETAHDRDVWLKRGLVQPSRSTIVNGAGVDSHLFHPRSGDRQPGPLRVLFASRLLQAKGLDAFLQVAEQLQPSGDIEFWVAGFSEPADADAYSSDDLAGRPSIRFLGSVTDMEELLRSVDVICLPTRYGEGIPRILIEAAASGIPCIASEIDGCREIVEHGRTGFLVPIGDIDTTAAAITQALHAYRCDAGLLARHGAAAHAKFVAGGYDEDTVISRFMALLEGRAPGAEHVTSA